jgi:hypothetical protein
MEIEGNNNNNNNNDIDYELLLNKDMHDKEPEKIITELKKLDFVNILNEYKDLVTIILEKQNNSEKDQ